MEALSTADAILTNGRVFAALMDDVVILPNGRTVSEDTAEEMGFEWTDFSGEKVQGFTGLTEACLEGVTARAAFVAQAEEAQGGGDSSYDRRGDRRGKLAYSYINKRGRRVEMIWI